MTPIFVRPVREQLEHDRLIRFLQAKFKAKRKVEVLANIGDERLAPIKIGTNTYFPDLLLMEGKRLAGVIEVETGESTNNLEAMAQWTHFSHARVPFYLYVPVLAVDAAKRLCDANQVKASEIWSYRAVNDQFDLVRVHSDPDAVRATARAVRSAAASSKPKITAKPAPKPKARPPAKPKAQARPATKPRAKSGAKKK